MCGGLWGSPGVPLKGQPHLPARDTAAAATIRRRTPGAEPDTGWVFWPFLDSYVCLFSEKLQFRNSFLLGCCRQDKGCCLSFGHLSHSMFLPSWHPWMGPCNASLLLPSYPHHSCGLWWVHHTIPSSLHPGPQNPNVLGPHRGWEWVRGAPVVGSLKHLLFQAVICATTLDMLQMKAPLQNKPWKVKSCSCVCSWCSATAPNVL